MTSISKSTKESKLSSPIPASGTVKDSEHEEKNNIELSVPENPEKESSVPVCMMSSDSKKKTCKKSQFSSMIMSLKVDEIEFFPKLNSKNDRMSNATDQKKPKDNLNEETPKGKDNSVEEKVGRSFQLKGKELASNENQNLDLNSVDYQPVASIITTTASLNNSTAFTSVTATTSSSSAVPSSNGYSRLHNKNPNPYYFNGVRKGYPRYSKSRRCSSRSPHRFSGNYIWANSEYDFYRQENCESDYYAEYSSYGPHELNENCYGDSGYHCSGNERNYNHNGYGVHCQPEEVLYNSNHKNGFYNNYNYKYNNSGYNYGRGRYKQGREDQLWPNYHPGSGSFYPTNFPKQNHSPPPPPPPPPSSHNGGNGGGYYRGRGRGRPYNSSLSPRTAKNNARNRYKTPPPSPLPHKWDTNIPPSPAPPPPPPPPYYYREEPLATSLTVDVGGGLGSLEECATMSAFCDFGLGGGLLGFDGGEGLGVEELNDAEGMEEVDENVGGEDGEGDNETEEKPKSIDHLKEENGHIVHFHINPGTTVNFTNSDGEVQRISGPATVRMVSTNSSPPIPLPVQMPPGHVVQQIVDETGTLQHVILSAQPMPMPVCSYGPNAGQGPPQFYSPPPGPPPPQGFMTSYQPAPPYPPVMSPPLTQPSPPPHNYPKNDRNARQHEKIRSKFYQRHQPLHHPHYQNQYQPIHLKTQTSSNIHNTSPISPKKGEEECLNGEITEGPGVPLQELLSHIKSIEVTGVEPYSANVHWNAPDISGASGKGISPSNFRYEVFLNNSIYDTVSSTTHLELTNLRPGTEYKLYLICVCNGVRGYQSPHKSFITKPTVPDRPMPPKLVDRKKNQLLLKWNAPKDNGAKILHYTLESCGGQYSNWTEVLKNRSKEFCVTKLKPETTYKFRLSAHNEVGSSGYSLETTATTVGLAPSQPSPPTLDNATVNSLKLSWPHRPCDDSFSLEMEDSYNEYGFMPVFNGSENYFTCDKLKRNSHYKFRLCAQNINGKSPFSEVACFRTLPDIPTPPSMPTMKGKNYSDKLIISWSSPIDHGGTPVTNYLVQIDKGKGFLTIYSGSKLECEATDLAPGTTYRVRCLAESEGGKSKWSGEGILTTKPVVPGQCKPPRLLGKPKAHTLQLKWGYPEFDGGSPVTEFQMDMMTPDTDKRQVYCGRDLECTVASLLPGRNYIFLLRAVNRIGPGLWSEPYEVVSGPGAPDAPRPPNLACKGPHIVLVSWDEPINNGASVDQYSVSVAELSCPNTESSESSSTCGDGDSELSYTVVYTGSATHAEVKSLSPATTYSFRVCASNVAGVGPFSSSSIVTTPAAPPAPVAHVTSSPEATEVTLRWTEPPCHGDSITHYNVEVGDRILSTVEPVLEFTVSNLTPETSYKFRVQAVNSVGSSTFSSGHRVTTQPLPPPPPHIELLKASYNSLRLKWGDGRNPDLLKYSLEMEYRNPHNSVLEFYQVYSGTNQVFKVGKLDENTTYKLRICACNEAGVGPHSDPVEFTTTKAPPPPLKAPRISEGPDNSYLVEWCGVRCPPDDYILYRMQTLQSGKDQDYSLIYVGSETSYTLKNLEPETGYYVRVCGVRMSGDKEVVAGAYSSPTLFNTPKREEVIDELSSNYSNAERVFQWHTFTDHQKALAILVLFSLLAFVAAYVLSPDVG